MRHSDNPRLIWISVRLTPEELDDLDTARAGVSRSEFVRAAIAERVER